MTALQNTESLYKDDVYRSLPPEAKHSKMLALAALQGHEGNEHRILISQVMRADPDLFCRTEPSGGKCLSSIFHRTLIGSERLGCLHLKYVHLAFFK